MQRLKVLCFILSLFLFCVFVKPSFAQETTLVPSPSVSSPTPASNEIANSKDLHVRSQSVVIEILAAFSCQLSGIDPVDPGQKCLGIDIENKKIGYVDGNGGAIGAMGHLIEMTYYIPISTQQYIASSVSDFGIVKNSYAQGVDPADAGTGWIGLKAILNLWKTFSNIVYVIFVLLFMLVGLGIMLRFKVDPRTVMTFQNQIPKIIITLILVFFSYPIAGLLVDLMWVSLYFIYETVNQAVGLNSAGKSIVGDFNPADIQGKSVFGAMGSVGGVHQLTHQATLTIKDAIQNLLGISGGWKALNPLSFIELSSGEVNGSFNPIEFFINFLSISAASTAVWKAEPFINGAKELPFGLGAIVDLIGGNAARFGIAFAAYSGTQGIIRTLLPYLIAYLVIFVALFSALFRLWFELIRAYIYILIGVILAPFWIAFGLIPGSTLGFGPWLKNLVAYLAVFPTTLFMFLLAKIISEAFKTADKNTVFLPPFIGNQNDAAGMGAIIAFMILTITPAVVQIVKDALKAPSLKYTSAVGQSVGAGTGAIKGSVATTGEALRPQYNYAKGVYGHVGLWGVFGRMFR